MTKYVNVKMEVVREYEKEYRVRFLPEIGGRQEDFLVYKKNTSECVEPPLDLAGLPAGTVIKNYEEPPVKWVKTVNNTFVCFDCGYDDPSFIGDIFAIGQLNASKLRLDNPAAV